MSLCLVVAVAAVFAALPAAQAAVTTNLSIPITLVVDIPCAGELVVLNGPLHILSTFTFDKGGGFHTAKAVLFETSFVNNFKIIGQGPGTNLLIHENFHLSINANARSQR